MAANKLFPKKMESETYIDFKKIFDRDKYHRKGKKKVERHKWFYARDLYLSEKEIISLK